VGLSLSWLASGSPAQAQYRKIGEMELRLSGLSASVENAEPVVPKNTPGGIRILVRAGGTDLSLTDLARFLGPGYSVQGELSGPGFPQPVALPVLQPGEEPPADPLVLRTPPVAISGAYRLSNLRIVANGRTVIDVEPSNVPLKVIDQILVTQVTTRALTLDEIRGKGIVLDSDDYLGFEFTMGFKLDSKAIDLKFPVVFDRQGVAVPQPLSPPAAPTREAFQLPTIMPLLLEAEGPNGERAELKYTTPAGVVKPITIPAVLVIPGNVGYLKQFFSAQLYVSNGAPVGSRLNVRDIVATLKLPPGADLQLGTPDDPLALPELERDGRVITQPLSADVRGLGTDGEAGTNDDAVELAPAEQGQAEFLIRGEQEGFHQINFDLTAQLLGLPIGPVTVKGKAMGGVLVRNPYFNVTFTVPSVVRTGEHFKMRATVTNIGKGIGNDVSMTLDASRMSGLILQGDATKSIPTLKAGDARSLEFEFVAQRTGKVVATYLKFDTQSGSSGRLNFTIGVGERNVPLSPDTLVLPASTDGLPANVVDAAMRVLGQAWSVANAPAGTLPVGVTRVSGQVAVKKALALAEAGLRVTLGQTSDAAVRDLLYDFYAGTPVDPGFDQLLRTTEAGHAFVQAVGEALSDAAMVSGGGPGYEFETARLIASSAPFVSFGWDGVRGDLALVDSAGRTTTRATDPSAPAVPGSQNVFGGVLVPLGSDMMLGLATQPSSAPYRWEFRAAEPGTGSLSFTFERPDGSFGRAAWSGAMAAGAIVRAITDGNGQAAAQIDAEGDGLFERTENLSVDTLPADGPRLLSAAIVGPETLDGAGPWGFQTALVFDRVVSEASAALTSNYSIPNNAVRSARRQLSGRLVFAALNLPEGPYIPTDLTARGIEDARGVRGGEVTTPLRSRLTGGGSAEIGAVVSGRVLDNDGTPIPGRVVSYAQFPSLVCGDAAAFAGFAAPVTDANGGFELRYVRRDRCGNPFQLFTLDPSSGARRLQSLHVRSAGQQIVADFVMFASGSVNGVVTDLSEQPVPGARVTVLSQTDTQVGAAAVTDALGRYSVTGITVGPVVVRAAKGNGVGSSAGRLDRANVPAVVNVTLDGGALNVHGLVRTLDDGVTAPAVGAVVTYYLTLAGGSQAMAMVQTDSLGRYAFSGMPVGSYLIRAQANQRDFATVTGVAVAEDGEITRDITVEIPPVTQFGYIDGLVVMPDGSPASDVIVSSGGASVLSDATGHFELPVIPKLSAHLVRADSRDRKRTGQVAVSVTASGQRVTSVRLTLSSLGAAEFTVVDMGGQPLPGRAVKLLDSRFDPCGRAPTTTDALGRARFEGLGVGAVNAQVVNEGEIVDASRGSVSISGEGTTAFGFLRVETRPASISGMVVDGANQPVSGADVELRSPAFVQDLATSSCGMQTAVTHRARTGPDGRFRFTAVHPGRVYLVASQAFFPTPVSQTHDLAALSSPEVTLKLLNTIAGRITGAVYEPDGTTSAGPGVEVTMNGALPDVTVHTNSAGEFAFPEVFPQGGYTITARDPITGLVERSLLFASAGVPTRHDIRLKGKATVKVRVETADAQPVENAYVTLREIAYPNRVFEGVLDASNQGVVAFPGVFEGQVSIEVRDPLGRSGGRNALTIPTGVAEVQTVVRVTTTGTVRGRFLRPLGDDAPIALGSVRLVVGGRVIGQVTTSATDPVGEFEFTYVPAGLFRLEGLDPNSGRAGLATGSIEEEGQVAVLDIRAQAIGTVLGTVTENGAPRAGARVELVSGAFSATTIADATGQYRIEGVPEGRVVISADLGASPGAPSQKGTASGNLAGEGSTLNLDVALRASGGIRGQVLKAGAGDVPAGVAAVSVYVGGSGGGVVTGSTDEDGTFEFTRVPSGLATITVEALGSDDFAIASVEVPEGGDPVDATIRLNGIGTLAGVGRDSLGAPVRGRLQVGYGPPERRRGVSLELASDGAFVLPGILAGPFTANLSAQVGGLSLFGTASGVIVDGQTTNVDIVLQDSATVSGRVLRADAVTPAYGASVNLVVAGSYASTSAQTQSDGTFSFRGVPLGSYVVRASDPLTGGLASLSASASVNGAVVSLGDLVLDDTPIQVVSTDPSAGALGVSVTQPLRIDFSDPLQGVTGLRVMNGAVGVVIPTPVLSNGGKTATLNPPVAGWPNPKTLTLVADTTVTDTLGRRLGQVFSSAFTTEDKNPPSVTAFSPVSGAIEVAPETPVVLTFSEPVVMNAAELAALVKLSAPGQGTIAGTTTQTAPSVVQFVPATPFALNATYTVVVTGAVDAFFNRQTAQQVSSFSTRDTVAPTLTLASPASVTASRRPTVTVFASDSLTGFDTAGPVTLSIDGRAVSRTVVSNGFFYVFATDLSEGAHAVSAQAQDRAGNVATLSSSFTVDASPPHDVGLTTPVAGQAIQGFASFAATASDDHSAIQKIEIREGSGPVLAFLFPPSFTGSVNTAGLGEGTHTFFARAYDSAGNVADSPGVSVRVDNSPLVVSFTTPAAGARFRDAVTATATVSEPVTQVDFSIPGATQSIAAPGPYTATFSLAGVPETEALTIQAVAHGQSGETSSASAVIAVDRTPPAPVVTARVLAEVRAASPVQVAGEVGAAEALATVYFTNTRTGAVGSAIVLADGSFQAALPGQTGDLLEVFQTDRAGNASESRTLAVVDGDSLGSVPQNGLSLWVSADTIVPDGSNPAGWSGSWTNNVSPSNSLYQNTASARPTLATSPVLGGLPVLRFDGSSDYLRFTSQINSVQTVFWVLQDTSGDSVSRSLLSNFAGTPTDFAPGGSGDALWSTSAGASVLGGQTWLNGSPVDGRFAGRPRSPSVLSLVTTGPVKADTFGTYLGVTLFFKGDLAEMLIYERALSAEERQEVEDYLVRKYRPYTPRVAAPQITPPGGVLTGPATVAIATSTPGATVRYTLDGSTPTENSPEYPGPFTVELTTTVKAAAFRPFFQGSAVTTAGFIRDTEGPIRDPNLLVWVRADAGFGSTSGTYVPQWTNQANPDNSLIQPSGFRLPQHVPAASHGLPLVRFDGSSDFIRFATPLSGIRTVFFVTRESDSATGTFRYLLGDTAASFPFASGALTLWEPTNTSTAVRNGDTYVNGAPVDGTVTARPRNLSVVSVVTTAGLPARHFGSLDGTSQFWWGDLGEMLIYDRALSPQERRQVEAYLYGRHAIAPAAATFGTVNVDVKRAGVNQSGVAVTILSDSITALTSDRTKLATTSAAGRASASLPVGFVTARVTDGTTQYEATGTLRVSGTLTLAINLPALATALKGRIVASDAVTPLPGATVAVGPKQATTDANGNYRIDAPATGLQSVIVSFQSRAEFASANIVPSAETVLDYTYTAAPFHVVAVSERGTGAPMPGVSITACDLSAPFVCAPAQMTDSQGLVRYLGQPGGVAAFDRSYAITAVAPDGASLGASATFPVSSPGRADILFLPPGNVHGLILLPGGSPVEGAQVWAWDDEGFVSLSALTGADGAYSFRRVGGRHLTLFAQDPAGLVEATATVDVPVGGDLTADLTLPLARLQVNLVDSLGQAVANQDVEATFRGPRAVNLPTDAQGRAVFVLPAGFTRFIVRSSELAAGEVELAAGDDRTLTLTLGSHHPAAEVDGYTVAPGPTGAVRTAQFALSSFDVEDVIQSTQSTAGRTESGVSNFAPSWHAAAGIYFHQKVFVPAGAAYARSLSLFTNPTDVERTVNVTATLDVCCQVETADGSLTFEGAYSVVFGRDADANCGEGCAVYRQLVLPPHSTRGLMAFTTMDPGLIPSLLNLSATGAIADLTEAERAAIVNFDVLEPITAVVEGVAQSSTGSALSGATVALARGDSVVTQGITAADGSFALTVSEFAGLYRLVFVSGDQFYEGSVTIQVSGSYVLGPLRALDPGARGAVRIVMEDGTGGSVADLALSAQSTRFLGLDPAVPGATDATGAAVISGLLPGLNRIETPLGAAYARVVAGGEAVVRLRRGPGTTAVAGTVTLNGQPVLGAVVVGTLWDPDLQKDVVAVRATTGPNGSYELAGAREGESMTLYAWDPDLNRHASAWVNVLAGPDATPADPIQLATDDAIGSLLVRAVRESDGLPVAGANATLELMSWPFSIDLTLDAQGEARVDGLPGGSYATVSITGPTGVGRETALLESARGIVLELPVGNRVALPALLGGYLVGGNLVSETANSCFPFCAQGYAAVGGASEPFTPAGSAAVSGGGRELTMAFRTPSQYGVPSPLRLVRRVYVPPDGRFARIVDVLENVSADGVTASHAFSGSSFASGETVAEVLGDGVVDASDAAFVLRSSASSAETAGFVVRGTNAPPPLVSANDYGMGIEASFIWDNLTLAPGQKVAFMTFVVFERGALAATVPSRVTALRDLTDAGALEGLSAADRALIVNWILP